MPNRNTAQSFDACFVDFVHLFLMHISVIIMVEVEKDVNKIIKYFTLDQFKQIAEMEGIEVEDGDTKKDIYEALVAEDDD